MRKRNFKQFYVLINTKDLSIHICSTKTRVADIVGCHRSTVDNLKERECINDYIVTSVKEE